MKKKIAIVIGTGIYYLFFILWFIPLVIKISLERFFEEYKALKDGWKKFK